MKAAVPALFGLFMAVSPLHSDDAYTPIDLSPVANFKIDAVKKYPTGHVRFKGVPFELPSSRQGIQTEGPLEHDPTMMTIPASVRRPTAIYILLSGAYVEEAFKGKQVGEFVLEFNDNKTLTYPIIAWQTIRETWAYNTNIQQPDSQGNPKLVNVYQERQFRGKPATAFLDMYVVELERDAKVTELTNIIVKDASRETVGNVAPGLIITGITVKHE